LTEEEMKEFMRLQRELETAYMLISTYEKDFDNIFFDEVKAHKAHKAKQRQIEQWLATIILVTAIIVIVVVLGPAVQHLFHSGGMQ